MYDALKPHVLVFCRLNRLGPLPATHARSRSGSGLQQAGPELMDTAALLCRPSIDSCKNSTIGKGQPYTSLTTQGCALNAQSAQGNLLCQAQ